MNHLTKLTANNKQKGRLLCRVEVNFLQFFCWAYNFFPILVGGQNLPRHVNSIYVTSKGLFHYAKGYLFSCRECYIAHLKWTIYFLCFFAVWQAQVPHNLGWEEGSSNSLPRRTEKNCQDSPAKVGLLKECLCIVAGKPVYLSITSLTFFPVSAVSLPVHGL